ncbi:MAG TPA: PAC2 family protein [Thermoleophilaceae bacterium]|nr:PAC2 family protein [Thermoleophilaceae bacterium]
MSDLTWSKRPVLRSPVLVAAFHGWNDAGDAASAALEFIRAQYDTVEVATIDPEDFMDFTSVRPQVKVVQGGTREILWPDSTLSTAEVPGADGDLVILQGVEPCLHWRRYTETIIEAARALDVRMVITLGALLNDVPHTRPVSVTGIASDPALVDRLGYEGTSYEGPTGITGVLHHACAAAGLPSVSLWASVPHYVAAAPNPKVALALVRGFEGAAGVVVDAGELESAAEDYERQVSAAVASDPEVKAFVERLESAVDEVSDERPPENLPSADMIASDFQRFLRQRGPGA